MAAKKSIVEHLQSMVLGTKDNRFGYAHQEAMNNFEAMQKKYNMYLDLAWKNMGMTPDTWRGGASQCEKAKKALIAILEKKSTLEDVASILDISVVYDTQSIRFLPTDLPFVKVVYLLEVEMNRSVYTFLDALETEPRYKLAENSLPAAEQNRREWSIQAHEIFQICEELLDMQK